MSTVRDGRPAIEDEHFRLSFFSAVVRLYEFLQRSYESIAEIERTFPFLAGYRAESLRRTDWEPTGSSRWQHLIDEHERTFSGHLPLRALREGLSLEETAEAIWTLVGLLDEDPRFGLVFEDVQGLPGQRRPTLALLTLWWGDFARGASQRLIQEGLLQVVNADAPRLEWAVQVEPAVWDAIRGERRATPLPGMIFREASTLPRLEALILPPAVRELAERIPGLVRTGGVDAVIVRGPRNNGRRTLLRSLAGELELSTLEIAGRMNVDDSRLKTMRLLSLALRAMPIRSAELSPGESEALHWRGAGNIPLGMAVGKHGGIRIADEQREITIELPLPDPAARRAHWQVALAGTPADLDALAAGPRLSSGNIRRAASAALAEVAVAGRKTVTGEEVRRACRLLNREAIDTLATRLPPAGEWSDLAATRDLKRQLNELTTRCRHRETLSARVGSVLARTLTSGVRAMFTGPSGTGKSLAARLLAARLGADIYRLDLSALVSKYLGETERNIHQALTLAEELDVMLLLDEGDALLAPRTGIQNSNDRYANLETNYLLQRLETFEGVLVITTNAVDRIDSAFQRRMDVVIEFSPPDAAERQTIWASHLPVDHAVDWNDLGEIAGRCALTGGQIRNAVLHAAVLSVEEGTAITSRHVLAAVQREYRKVGTTCPLRNLHALRE